MPADRLTRYRVISLSTAMVYVTETRNEWEAVKNVIEHLTQRQNVSVAKFDAHFAEENYDPSVAHNFGETGDKYTVIADWPSDALEPCTDVPTGRVQADPPHTSLYDMSDSELWPAVSARLGFKYISRRNRNLAIRAIRDMARLKREEPSDRQLTEILFDVWTAKSNALNPFVISKLEQ